MSDDTLPDPGGRGKPLWDTPQQAQHAMAIVRANPIWERERPLHYVHRLAVLSGLVPMPDNPDGEFHCGVADCKDCR